MLTQVKTAENRKCSKIKIDKNKYKHKSLGPVAVATTIVCVVYRFSVCITSLLCMPFKQSHFLSGIIWFSLLMSLQCDSVAVCSAASFDVATVASHERSAASRAVNHSSKNQLPHQYTHGSLNQSSQRITNTCICEKANDEWERLAGVCVMRWGRKSFRHSLCAMHVHTPLPVHNSNRLCECILHTGAPCMDGTNGAHT